jgi:hypothetical protein
VEVTLANVPLTLPVLRRRAEPDVLFTEIVPTVRVPNPVPPVPEIAAPVQLPTARPKSWFEVFTLLSVTPAPLLVIVGEAPVAEGSVALKEAGVTLMVGGIQAYGGGSAGVALKEAGVTLMVGSARAVERPTPYPTSAWLLFRVIPPE